MNKKRDDPKKIVYTKYENVHQYLDGTNSRRLYE